MKWNKTWTEVLLFSIASIFLYQTSIGIFFFLIPLQIINKRNGSILFNYSILITFVSIVLIKLIRISGIGMDNAVVSLVLLEILILISLLGGLYLLNNRIWNNILPFSDNILSLLILTGIFGLLSVPVILYYKNNAAFNKYMSLLFDNLSKYLKSMFASNNQENLAILNTFLNPNSLMQTTNRIFFRTFIFDFFAMLGFSKWIGTLIANRNIISRTTMQTTLQNNTQSYNSNNSIVNFKVPEYYLWPFIVSLAITLVDYIKGLGPIGYAAWNTTLILALLYGINALGIMRYLFSYFRMSRGLQLIFYTMLVILLMTPKINILMLIAIPGLGVSEIWIKYREIKRREE